MSNEIAALLRAQPLFSGLGDRELDGLAGRGTLQTLPMGRTLFQEGEPGKTAYLVFSGRVRVLKGADDQEVTLGTLKRGDFVGERAALTGALREASVRAAEETVVVGFDSEAFRAVCAGQPQLARYFERLAEERALINFLRINTFVSALPPAFVAPFIERLDACCFAAGATIFSQGEPADRLFVVAEGQVRITQRREGCERVLATLDEGDYFGERALIMSEPRVATATAVGAVRCLTISKGSIDALLEAVPKVRAEFAARISLYNSEPAAAPDQPGGRQAAARPPRTLDYQNATPTAAARHRRSWRGGRFSFRRFPWLPQHDATDCGAASLAMIARYHGKRLPIARLRELADVGREGASLYGVAKAAEKVGFATRAVRTDYGQLADLQLPAIAHWAGDHYIVLYAVSDRGVVVGDPAVGVMRLTRAAFEADWSGRLLILAPTERLALQDEQGNALGRILPLLRPHRAILAGVVLASLLISLLGIALPLFIQTIIDRVLAYQDVRMLNLMLAGMLVVVVCSTLTAVLRHNLLFLVGQKIGVRMSSDLFRRVLRLAMPYFDKRNVGDLLTRLSDHAKLRELITGDAVGVVLDLSMTLIYLAVMLFFYSASLTALALLFLSISVVATLVITPLITRNNQLVYERIAASDSKLIETLRNIAIIKSAAAEPPIRLQHEESIVENAQRQWRSARLAGALRGIASGVRLISGVVVLWYGALLVIDGALSVGQLVAFLALYGMVMAPVLGLIRVWQQMQEAHLSLERLSEVYDAPLEQAGAAQALVDLPALRGHIRFENVSFGYGEEAPNVLSNIDLEVQPGQVVALVGRSGAGKSTLIALLERLYRPTRGRILIDGIDIAAVSTESLRRQIGVCPQDAPLLTGTIRDNIALGDPGMAMDDVIAAARMADAHAFIAALPLGYDTVIGEAGIRLSGGQRQRLAIARALLRRPPILVFDEATSLLDAESERTVQANLAGELEGRTALVVAHRLATIRDADLIAVIDDGMVVESGSHAELMAKRGLYHYLAGRQLGV